MLAVKRYLGHVYERDDHCEYCGAVEYSPEYEMECQETCPECDGFGHTSKILRDKAHLPYRFVSKCGRCGGNGVR